MSALRKVKDISEVDRYQAIFEHSSDAILVIDGKGHVMEVNQAAQELTGHVAETLKHHDQGLKLLSPVSGTHVPARAKALSGELVKTEGTFEDVAIVQADGLVRLVDLSVRRLEDSSLWILVLRDVTEKKRMERELITKHSELRAMYVELERKNTELVSMQQMLVQAGKMAALGELSAGIAHEINQPLTAIRGYAQEIQSTEKLSDSAANFLGEIIQGADKMSKIIQSLRSFTRKSTEDFEWTDIHDRIEESLKMLSRQFEMRGIVVSRKYSKEVPQVFANPVQLEQVFINLATNARDAIESKGAGKGTITIHTTFENQYVQVDFGDDGIGMTDSTKKKIFNPFFTTKEVGKGMGLGLSLSFGMIEKLHGSMVVESQPGKGTLFKVRIPVDYRELA